MSYHKFDARLIAQAYLTHGRGGQTGIDFGSADATAVGETFRLFASGQELIRGFAASPTLLVTPGTTLQISDYFRLGNLSTSQRNALSPAYGLALFNTDTNNVEIYKVGGWSTVAGGGASFTIWQTPNGTSPTAIGVNDTMTLTSSDSTVTITGNSSTDTIDFKVNLSAVNPMTTLGDTTYGGSGGAATRLAGNTTATRKFLRQTGTGSASAAPAWDTLVAGDIPALPYAPTDSPTFTTAITFGNYKLHPSEYNAGNSGTTLTIDWTNGSAQKVAMTGNCTFTLSNPQTGGAYVLKLAQDVTGGRTYTWPASVKWSGGTAPTGSAASKVDLINLYWDGTNYFGSYSLNY